MNWNILVTLGKEIKRDSMISVNENRRAYINIRIYSYPDNELKIYCNRISSINITKLVDKLSTDKLNK